MDWRRLHHFCRGEHWSPRIPMVSRVWMKSPRRKSSTFGTRLCTSGSTQWPSTTLSSSVLLVPPFKDGIRLVQTVPTCLSLRNSVLGTDKPQATPTTTVTTGSLDLSTLRPTWDLPSCSLLFYCFQLIQLLTVDNSGCWCSDPINYYLGRRGTIFISAIFCLLTPIGGACSQNWEQLFITRILMGIG
jgi:hypothetical protein